MDRFTPYFLGHILALEDHFCRYFVQSALWCHQEILDVPHMQLFDEEAAEQWLGECLEYEHYDTITSLRCFLSEEGQEGWQLHYMDDGAVVRAAALELTLHRLKVVIRPKLGTAVAHHGDFPGHGYPFLLLPEPDLDHRFSKLARHLDALVTHQRRRLATLRDLPDEARTDTIRTDPGQIALAVNAWPGFHPGLLKLLSHIGHAPERIQAMRQAAWSGTGPGPIAQQIKAVSMALYADAEKRLACRAMLTIVLTDPEVMQLIQAFARPYLSATHELERRQLGITTEADMVTAFILAVAVLTSDRFETIAARASILSGAATQIRQIADDLKNTEPRHRQPAKRRRPATAPTQQPQAPNRTPPADPFKKAAREDALAVIAPIAPAGPAAATEPRSPAKAPAPEKAPFGFKAVTHLSWDAYDKGSRQFKLGEADNAPISGKAFKIKLPDGSIREETTDGSGVIEIVDQDPGDTFEILFKPENARLNNKYHLFLNGQNALDKTL